MKFSLTYLFIFCAQFIFSQTTSFKPDGKLTELSVKPHPESFLWIFPKQGNNFIEAPAATAFNDATKKDKEKAVKMLIEQIDLTLHRLEDPREGLTEFLELLWTRFELDIVIADLKTLRSKLNAGSMAPGDFLTLGDVATPLMSSLLAPGSAYEPNIPATPGDTILKLYKKELLNDFMVRFYNNTLPKASTQISGITPGRLRQYSEFFCAPYPTA